MTKNRISIRLDVEATKALAIMAGWEFRDVPSQAALIIREELIRRGLLTQETLVDLEPTREEVLIKDIENG